MVSEELLAQLRSRQSADLRACFPKLAEREIIQLLCSTPQHAVYVLQQCFRCDMEDAKAAWNDYVLRYLDGPARSRRGASETAAAAFALGSLT